MQRKQTIDQFVNQMIVDMYNEYDLSRVHILEAYKNTLSDTDPSDAGRKKAYEGFIYGWYRMMESYNKGCGLTPTRSIGDYKNDSC